MTRTRSAGNHRQASYQQGRIRPLRNVWELAALVLRRIKRATAGSVWSFEVQGKRLPRPGDLSIVTTWSAEPLCIIETLSVEITRFCDVGADFAAAEGEGDRSLAYWQAAHRAYFTRESARANRAFAETLPIACERFRVVFPVDPLKDQASG